MSAGVLPLGSLPSGRSLGVTPITSSRPTLCILVFPGLGCLVSQANTTPGSRAKVYSPFSLQNLTPFQPEAGSRQYTSRGKGGH